MNHSTFPTASLVVLLLVPVAVAQDAPVQSSGSHRISGKDETHTVTDPDFPIESRNPDAAAQKRLRVHWDKVSMGFYEQERNPETFREVWHDSDALRPARELGVRGRLLIVSGDGKVTQPVDWCQGVRVVLTRKPRVKPDWSKRQDFEDSIWKDCLLDDDGTFVVQLDPARISRPVRRTEQFQIALSLGTKEGKTITWKNTVAVLPQSVATIAVTGLKALSPTMQAINGAPSVRAKDFNPVMLIRAVNHLHTLGKEGAIAELRTFLEIAVESRNATRAPENIDTSDYQCVFLIVRLLFEPSNARQPFPPVGIGVMYPSPTKEDEGLWPLFPLVLQDDIPFILIQGAELNGWPEHPSSHVDWAEKYGKLRAKPLRPSDDPLGAVDKVVALPQTQRLFKKDFEAMRELRRQGWRMFGDFARESPTIQSFSPKNLDDAAWKAAKEIAAKLKIRWDEERQAYVAR